jgi:hypothetical protein
MFSCCFIQLLFYFYLKANSQRHIYISEQLNEAHLLIQNLVKHKQKFVEIINRTPSANFSSSTTFSNGKLAKNSTSNKSSLNKTSIKSTKTSKSSIFKHKINNSSKSLIKSKLKFKE